LKQFEVNRDSNINVVCQQFTAIYDSGGQIWFYMTQPGLNPCPSALGGST